MFLIWQHKTSHLFISRSLAPLVPGLLSDTVEYSLQTTLQWAHTVVHIHQNMQQYLLKQELKTVFVLNVLLECKCDFQSSANRIIRHDNVLFLTERRLIFICLWDENGQLDI